MTANPGITAVMTPADLDAVRVLFQAYAASLDVDLAYQGFEAELAGLPGAYAASAGGVFLLARERDGTALGCVALRGLAQPGVCEMKRLYVAPMARGTGLGGRLVDAVVAEARRLGYREMWLDTLPSMRDAQTVYAKRGFTAMEPYYVSPVAGTLFMRRLLA